MKIEEAVAIRTGKEAPSISNMTEWARDQEEAMETLADAYLAQLQEDGGEVLPVGRHEEQQYDLQGCHGDWQLYVWNKARTSVAELDQREQPTMGQLRALVKALGGGA